MQKKIASTTKYLNRFFDNILFDGNCELKNRFLHIDWKEDTVSGDTLNGGTNGGLNGGINGGLTSMQKSIMELIEQNQYISVLEISKQTNISRRTIENNIKKLKDAGKIERVGSKKTGCWKVI